MTNLGAETSIVLWAEIVQPAGRRGAKVVFPLEKSFLMSLSLGVPLEQMLRCLFQSILFTYKFIIIGIRKEKDKGLSTTKPSFFLSLTPKIKDFAECYFQQMIQIYYCLFMSLPKCNIHKSQQQVICCEDQCLKLFCHDCFEDHHPEHNIGVILNKQAQDTLIIWIKFLLERLSEIKENLNSKGYARYFEMKLNPNYPKGLLNEISTSEILTFIKAKLDENMLMLKGNSQYIQQCKTLSELNNPGVLKDVFLFFLFDTNRNLAYLLQNFQIGLRQEYPHKQIYNFVYFAFNPKEFRQLELKRKELVRSVEKSVLVKLKMANQVYSPKLLNERRLEQNISPQVSKFEQSPSIRMNLSPRRLNIEKEVVSPSSPKSPIPNRFIRTSTNLKSPENNEPQEIPPIKKVEIKSAFQVGRKNIEAFTINNIQQAEPIKIEEKQTKNSRVEERTQEKEQSAITINSASEIQFLKLELQKRQRSIKQLNNLISNEEEELYYRENEVQMLQSEIKKLLSLKTENVQLKKENNTLQNTLVAKERSIKELNNLISNEEEELCYRENQVEVLSEEIKKMLKSRQKVEELEKSLQTKEKQIERMRDNFHEIKKIFNIFQDGEGDEIISSLRKVQEQNQSYQSILRFNQKKQSELQQTISILVKENTRLEEQIKNSQKESTVDEQLLAETIELEAEITQKNDDLNLLIKMLKESSQYLPENQRSTFRARLNTLKTIKLLEG